LMGKSMDTVKENIIVSKVIAAIASIARLHQHHACSLGLNSLGFCLAVPLFHSNGLPSVGGSLEIRSSSWRQTVHSILQTFGRQNHTSKKAWVWHEKSPK
jgi:hypothetical protein